MGIMPSIKRLEGIASRKSTDFPLLMITMLAGNSATHPLPGSRPLVKASHWAKEYTRGRCSPLPLSGDVRPTSMKLAFVTWYHEPFMSSDDQRFRQALRKFDEVHRSDPRKVEVNGRKVAWSLLYHERLTYWVRRLEPNTSEPLLLAARCQHLRRWTIPRSSYPGDRTGYKNWRRTLAKFHAQEAAKILDEVGYDQMTIDRLQELLQKIRLKLDPEVQLLEDALCLVFLENEFSDFARKHDDEKLMRILQKTWSKMSPRGQAEAPDLLEKLPEKSRALVTKATRE